MSRARQFCRGLIAYAAPLWAFAQVAPPPAAPAAPALPEVVRQKERLVRSLLDDSAAAARIRASGDEAARRSLDAAQGALAGAQQALRGNDWAVAQARLDEAVKAVAQARRLVPDDTLRRAEGSGRFQRLLDATTSLRAAYAYHAGRLRGLPAGAAITDDELLARLGRALDEASAQAAAGRPAEATRTLEQAHAALLGGLNRILGAKTLDYALRFATPAEEFAYEGERNRSLAELVPIAVAELRPSEGAARLVARYAERSSELRERAWQEAGNRNLAAALETLRESTAYLQRALLSAGLVTPPEVAPESREPSDN